MIKNVIEAILIPGLQFDSFELRALTNSTLDNFNEFVFFNFQKNSKKFPDLSLNVQNFVQVNKALFYYMLRRIAITLLFEDHKNVWIFNKLLHSTMIICELCEPQEQKQPGVCQTSLKIFEEVINTFETNNQRRTKMLLEVERLCTSNVPMSLDHRDRDAFTSIFSGLKNFLYAIDS
jgi:hypothetical protein